MRLTHEVNVLNLFIHLRCYSNESENVCLWQINLCKSNICNICKTSIEKLVRDKKSRLFFRSIGDEGKKFNEIDTWIFSGTGGDSAIRICGLGQKT